MKSIIEIYILGRKKEWRWRIRDQRNGRIVGTSSESYKNRHQLVSNLKRVTGINYIPKMRYGTKLFRFQIRRDGDGCAIYHD